MEIWDTVPVARTALFVVHNGTTLDRLLDVAEVFAGDLRVRIVATSDLSDPFAEGLPELVAKVGLATVPWSEATRNRYDLIVSASHHGPLDELRGPLLTLAHGAGFGKYAPGSRSVFGLDAEWLLDRHGRPLAAALGLARPYELGAAADTAVVVGDPCFDHLVRMNAERAQDTVVITSTWGNRSLLGVSPQVIDAVVGAGYDTRLILHPNIWARHGEHQVRLWLRNSLERGLTLVPPLRAWRRELATAGYVIGDHGSVTVYGAALGKPTLLAAFPDDQVVPGSPAHRLGELAGRYDPGIPVDVQLDKATGHRELTELVTAVPGEARARLQATCYRLLDLEEPEC
ncbi:hypothetical protein [Actinoplanes sp. NPDC051411]|uniref:hypothetical protein n=1 Tax=Actinoplanes sp. NPDC051411 TaxID=3155522 RepID=UPI0034200BB6